MSSSSNSKDSPDKRLPIKKITDKLTELLTNLSKAKKHLEAPKEIKGQDIAEPQKDSDDHGIQMDMHNQLDKVCKELRYIINAFNKLDTFEADISKPLDTLDSNVKDIQTDLKEATLTDSVKQQIKRNLKVLRGNITKVKIQIPLQHQVSATASDASRYLQTTTASKEVGHLPTPYEAREIFETSTLSNGGGSFAKEFQDRYTGLEPKLKLCLLCFAIFPEEAEVKKRLLRFWWSGERLRPGPGEKEEKEFVDKTLEKFVEMDLIEPVAKKNKSPATSYKMHPIIRALIIKFAKEANFFDYDPKGKPTMIISASKKSCLAKSEGTTPWFSKNFSQPKTMSSTDNLKQNLSKKEQKQKEQKDDEQRIQNAEKKRQKNLEELQTLFNVSKQFPDLPVELFSMMRKIGVLYLGKWEGTAERHIELENTEFLTGLKNMKKLRFFSLQGISGIQKLPESLGKVSNLRILDLRACHALEELPKEIGSLKMLTHLDLSECYLLDNMPKQLSHLSELKVLKGFVISKNSPCKLDKLAALSNLEKLSINVNDDDFSINEKEVVFFKFNALKKLKIAWGAGVEGAKSTNIGSNGSKRETTKAATNPKPAGHITQTLQMLKNPCGGTKTVPNQTEKLPQEVGMKLEKLDLQCFPEREAPEWLVPENLKCLTRLYIRGGEFGNLPANKEWEVVKILRLKFLTNIKTNWKELRIQFPKLEYLEKANCPQITFCPCDANGVWLIKKQQQQP